MDVRIGVMDYSLLTEFDNNLQPEWDALLEQSSMRIPFMEYAYQKLWWETKGGGEWLDARLLLIMACEEGRLVGIAPLFASTASNGAVVLNNVGAVEVSDFLDLPVIPSRREEFITGLLAYIQHMDIKGLAEVNLYNLLDSSPTLSVLQDFIAGNGWSVAVEKLQHSPYIPLPGDWETYLAGIDKKQRHEVRRKMRRAEEADIPVRWYLATNGATLDTEIDGFLELMKNDGDKEEFLRPAMQDFIRRVVHFAFDAGCLQLAFLEVEGRRAAAYLSFDYGGRIWVYNSGLNRDYQSLSPGWVLLGYLLQWANENGRTEFDFMRGDEEYKYRFGAVDRFVMRARLTPETVK